MDTLRAGNEMSYSRSVRNGITSCNNDNDDDDVRNDRTCVSCYFYDTFDIFKIFFPVLSSSLHEILVFIAASKHQILHKTSMTSIMFVSIEKIQRVVLKFSTIKNRR